MSRGRTAGAAGAPSSACLSSGGGDWHRLAAAAELQLPDPGLWLAASQVGRQHDRMVDALAIGLFRAYTAMETTTSQANFATPTTDTTTTWLAADPSSLTTTTAMIPPGLVTHGQLGAASSSAGLFQPQFPEPPSSQRSMGALWWRMAARQAQELKGNKIR